MENWDTVPPEISVRNEVESKPNHVENFEETEANAGNLTVQPHPKRKFIGEKFCHVGAQWSQEENSEICGEIAKPNGHSYSSSSEERPAIKQCFSHNNNLVFDKTNLRCSDEKSCRYYRKFPFKVNNNLYTEKPLNLKDGMEDYYEQFSSGSGGAVLEMCDETSSLSHKSHTDDYYQHQNPDHKVINPEHINALNGEEVDEDEGCIYTYKGDNYEANLSHLFQTCFSCGLPTAERSGGQNGAISIQRILNGSAHPKPNPQSSLYSPEMDFLEMDFDPGSNGDGGDSDCEDNNSVLNIDTKSEENSLECFSQMQESAVPKTNNIPNEIRSLICEMCAFNEQKVNNTTNISSKSTDSNFKSNLQSGLDDRPIHTKILDSTFRQQNINVKINHSSDKNISRPYSSQMPVSLFSAGKSFSYDDRKNRENNLNASERNVCEDFSDGADDADDEGDDDSVSEFLLLNSLFIPSKAKSQETLPKTLNSVKTTKQLRFSSQNTYANLSNSNKDAQTLNHNGNLLQNCLRESNISKQEDRNLSQNNNLGSISAPEVSPSKEYSPLEKFSRSVSFHNQLSSPKYENVCFSHPYKDNFLPSINKYQPPSCSSYNYCDCKHSTLCKVSQEPETTNLEACVDRLTQREKSVFNIISNPLDSPQDPVAGPSHSNCIQSDITSSSVGEQDLGNVESSTNQEILSSLPTKGLQPKVNDLFKDPNTVSEEDLKKENRIESQTSQVEKVMVWTERQATSRQVSQIGTSACGPTAVVNVLLALDHSLPIKVVTSQIKTRLRAEGAPLVDYLLSRSQAGTTHQDLIKGVKSISKGAVEGRFFHMFPKRAFQLSRWLTRWIKKGGVPVATLNLQVGVPPGQTVPDAWHHQMVFGVGPQGIYLTNPLECVSDSLLSDQLCSDSVLLVRRSDVVSRWDQKDKLVRLSLQTDSRWNDMNVLGQVVCVLKEEAAPEMLQGKRHLTSHVAIPASYQSGVTIFVRADNPCIQELLGEPELPLLDE